jgi:hypothetical protein
LSLSDPMRCDVRYTSLCYNCTGVRSCYDEGKRTAETLTMDYHRGAGVEVKLQFLIMGSKSNKGYLVGNGTFKNYLLLLHVSI